MNKQTWIAVVVAMVVILGLYWSIGQRPDEVSTGLANPASVNCEETLGGTLEITTTPAGQVGYCHLKDGRVCEEWVLLRDGTCTSPGATDYKNATYMVDDASVTLAGGVSEVQAAPGSSAMLTTRYFGNEATGDLNGDGVPDVAFILTQSGGGSGTFYYIVAALKTATGYTGTNAILLGDRIAPQTTEIKDGEIIVNYAERKLGEPMTARPSVGVSKYLRVENGTLVEVPVP